MHPVRRNRLFAVAFLLVGVAVTVMLVMRALNENINLFYPPGEVVSGKAPVGPRIRAGGMVKDGSLQRASDGLEVRFVVTDLAGSDFIVVYNGILPDLFREGKGVLATARHRLQAASHRSVLGMARGGRSLATLRGQA